MRTLEQIGADAVPFPKDLIKHLPPRNEAYVSWTHYTQRILKVHGAHRYQVTSVVYGDGQWAVAVRIQFADTEYYDGVGFDKDATHAESQAYKRACAHAGIGLHLYGEYWLDVAQPVADITPTGSLETVTVPAGPEPRIPARYQLSQKERAKAPRKTAKDYENAAKVAVLESVGGDKAEAAALWPLLLEKAGVESVTTKKGMEAVIRAANDTATE